MTGTSQRIRGLYAITDAGLQAPERLPARVEAALAGGARIVQYRDKSADAARRRDEAARIGRLCSRYEALFIVNDDVALAAEVGADGVHVGRDDAKLESARAALGPGAVIGVSCYNELTRAHAAVAGGADYVAFGSVFPSPTKPTAVRAPLSLFAQAHRQLGVPIVAIGGITAANAGAVIEAGADAIAVVAGVFAAGDVRASARALTRLFPVEVRP